MKRQPDWTDDTIMPWGKHKGTVMRDVPVDFLFFLIEQPWIKDYPEAYAYLKANEERIKQGSYQEHTKTGSFDSFEDYQRFLPGF